MTKNEFERQVWASDLTPNEKLVALAFAAHAKYETGTGIYLSVLGASAKTGLHRNTVQKTVKSLVEKGFLVPDGIMRGNVTRYMLGFGLHTESATEEGYLHTTSATTDEVSCTVEVQPATLVAHPSDLVAHLEGVVAQPVATNLQNLQEELKETAGADAPGSSDESTSSLLSTTKVAAPSLQPHGAGTAPYLVDELDEKEKKLVVRHLNDSGDYEAALALWSNPEWKPVERRRDQSQRAAIARDEVLDQRKAQKRLEASVQTVPTQDKGTASEAVRNERGASGDASRDADEDIEVEW